MDSSVSDSRQLPLLIGFVGPDTAQPLADVLSALDLRFELTQDISTLIPFESHSYSNDPGEPVHGRDGQLFNAIVQKQPLIIVFEMENLSTDWQKWIGILKSSAATRRIPVILLATEIAASLQDEVQRKGVELLIAPDAFLANPQNIIQNLDRRPDYELLKDACREPLSALAIKGLELFNAGEYFEAHEELEDAWNEDEGPARELYRGILQVGVAYLQIERQNYRGAVKMLLRVKQWLDPLPAECRTVDVDRLRRDAAAVYDRLLNSGPDHIAEFDRSLFKPVIYRSGHPS